MSRWWWLASRRLRWLAVVGWFGVMMLVAFAFACARSDDGATATSVAAVTVTVIDGGAIPPIEQEPSAVWTPIPTPFGTSNETLVVGYNDETTAAVDGGSPMGWALSTDQGVTFSQCNANAPCNDGGVDTSRVTGFNQFLRHPSLATDGLGHVVYVTLADTDGNLSTAERVVAVVGDGATFPTAFPVNQDSCGNGTQDMPNAQFDYTTSPPTLWVVWRHNGTGIGSFGGCIRRFFIDGTGSLVPLENALTIDGMDNAIGGSQGALLVQAGDGLVTVAYVNSDDNPNCPTGDHKSQAWGSVTSMSNGHDFVDNARIFETSDWRPCLENASKRRVQNTIRSFDFTRAPSGIEYVVLSDTEHSVRFFMNPAGGVKGWRDTNNTANPWLEWCPNTPTGDAGVTSNWKHHDDGPCDAPFANIGGPLNDSGLSFPVATLLPTITTDGDGRVAIGILRFFTIGASEHPAYLIQVNPNPLLPGSPFSAADVDNTVGLPASIDVPQKTVVQPFGAYFQMLAHDPATSQLITPGCSNDGDFFPIYVRASDAGTAQIATHSVQAL